MTHYASDLVSQHCEIVENTKIADSTYRLRFTSHELAKRMLPGQFCMVRLTEGSDPLIGRALAMYDRDGKNGTVDVVYVVKGKFTQTLSRMKSGSVFVWGPLGNTFSTQPIDHLVLVAGGVGQTPMLSVTKEALAKSAYGVTQNERNRVGFAKRVTLCYGARNKTLLAGLDDFHSACDAVRITTDDGSAGTKGLVTDSLRAILDEKNDDTVRVCCCGPEPMMEAVAKLCLARGVECEVSLETPMACGIGVCFTCVAKVCENSTDSPNEDNSDWDYKRTCVDGPIFDSRKLVW